VSGTTARIKVNFVYVQYCVLEDRLSGRKETALDASRFQEGEHVCKVIDVAIVKSQQNGVRRQVLSRGTQGFQ